MKSTNESDWTFPAVQSFGVVCCIGAGVLEQFWRVLPELKPQLQHKRLKILLVPHTPSV